MPKLPKRLIKAACTRMFIPTLEVRGRDSLDFPEVSVTSIKDVMQMAYQEGYRAAEKRLLRQTQHLGDTQL